MSIFNSGPDAYTAIGGDDELKLQLMNRTPVVHELDVFDARRALLHIAKQAGFDKKRSYYLLTAMTELGNNIVVHSHGGALSIWGGYRIDADTAERTIVGLKLEARDEGPGIANLSRAMEEGYSSINSMGCGLSGVLRLMDEFDIQSSEQGTRVEAWMWLDPHQESNHV